MNLNVACIGGGNGAAQIMKGLKNHNVDITGIIAITDSGRSTGKVRIAANIPAPGDIRNALITLSDADPFLQELFQFRFHSPKLTDLDGMAFGNLFIAVLSQMLGSFEKAVDKTAQFLQIKGKIIPIMLANVNIACERTDGTFDFEEVEIRNPKKAPIKRMFLKEEKAIANPKAIKAIMNADLITLGPGSLFTTVIACLLTTGIPKALSETKAKVVYVANTTTQSGQTETFTISDHVKTLLSYLPKNTIDICVINSKKPQASQLEKLIHENIHYLPLNNTEQKEIESLGIQVVSADVIEEFDKTRKLWNKQDTICHDPSKIAKTLLNLF